MDFLKNLWDKIYDKIYKVTRKFEGVNNFIFEKTGAKVDVGMIVFAIVFAILVLFFVKVILGIVMDKLYTGDY